MAKQRLRVGLVIDYIISDYSQVIISGIREACSEINAELYIFPIAEMHNIHSTYDYQNLAVTALITSKNLDGIIFCSGTQMHHLTKAELVSYLKSFAPLPVVNLSLEIPGIPSIVVECYNAYKVLIHNLIDVQKCDNFVVVGVKGNSAEAKSRTKYIKEIVQEKGIPSSNFTLLKASFHYSDTLECLEQYYAETGEFKFNALICLNDEMAYGALLFCKKHGFRIPEDLVLVGFDDLENSPCCFPSLTSINQQLFEQGRKAALILFDFIAGKNVDKLTIIEAKTVLRDSTCRKGYGKELENNDFCYIDNRSKSEIFIHNSGTEWYLKKTQLYQIANFYTEMQYNMTVEQLRSRINDDIRSFGISAGAVVLYEKPVEMATPFDYFNLPHKASVFSAFDDTIGCNTNNNSHTYKFDPNSNMIPDGILNANSEGLFVISLFHNTLQYGYMIIRPGVYDTSVYDLLTKIMSTIISSTYSYSLMDKEKNKFRAKYDKLDVIARTDELTGLNNRRGLYDLGQITLNFAKTMKQSGMIVYCDMDGLKKINDTFGHESGDRAIVAESIILRGNFHSNDIISRIGGDEFAIICPGLTKEAFQKIQSQVDVDCDKWTEDNNSPFNLSISMGAVTYPSTKVGYQITPLLAEADKVLYKIKREKKLNASRAECK